jgi:hypothetical protein
MEHFCTVRDGREHEIGEGYWLCKAVAADVEHKTVIRSIVTASQRLQKRE